MEDFSQELKRKRTIIKQMTIEEKADESFQDVYGENSPLKLQKELTIRMVRGRYAELHDDSGKLMRWQRDPEV